MRLIHLSSLLLALRLPSLGLAKERLVTRDFSVESAAALVVSTYRGGIVVRESDEPRIHVEVLFSTLAGDDDKGAGERLDREEPKITREGSTVTVSLANSDKHGVQFDWNEDKQVSVSITVTVPTHCSVSAATTDGSLTIGNLTGTMSGKVRVGTLFMKGIDGSVDAKVQSGDIIISHATGSVNLKTDRGDIRVGPVGGKATLKTTFGNIDFLQARGPVDASADSGSIAVGFSKDYASEAYVHADGGGISAWVPPTARCSIDASSVWGRVETQLPLELASGRSGSSRLAGRLNGGGAKLLLRASGGHVKLYAGDTAGTKSPR